MDYDPDKALESPIKIRQDTSGAKYAIIIGENELATKTVNLKNLQTGEQIAIRWDENTLSTK